jgi:hypothetical protein
MRKNTAISITILLVLYVMSYGWFRQTHREIWEKDKQEYLIFPSDKVYLYYFFRPIALLDGRITGMNFHIGQHQ